MRIGVVTTSYPRSRTDLSGRFVAELNEFILRSGHDVEVIAAGCGTTDDSWQKFPVERVPSTPGLFYQGGAPDALEGGQQALAAALFAAKLTLAVRRRVGHWDGVVAHWLAPSALSAALAARDLPLWALAHGGDVHLLASTGLAPAAALCLGRAGAQINFVSHSLRRKFSESSGAAGKALALRSTVAPMGVDLAHFLKLPKRRSAGAPQRLLFLGRLVPIKGVDVLLDALARSGGASPWSEVVIAGSGPSARALQHRARRLGLAVKWPGEVCGAARDALLASADVVVVPSRKLLSGKKHGGREEGMPRVALEALAVGAQLVVSDSGGLAEIPESICHRFRCADAAGLASILDKILGGSKAPWDATPWLKERSWHSLAPRLLPGLITVQK